MYVVSEMNIQKNMIGSYAFIESFRTSLNSAYLNKSIYSFNRVH